MRTVANAALFEVAVSRSSRPVLLFSQASSIGVGFSPDWMAVFGMAKLPLFRIAGDIARADSKKHPQNWVGASRLHLPLVRQLSAPGFHESSPASLGSLLFHYHLLPGTRTLSMHHYCFRADNDVPAPRRLKWDYLPRANPDGL